MLDAKVSLSQFDRTTEQLNALVQELLDKLSTSVRHAPKLAQLVLPVLVAPRHCGTRACMHCAGERLPQPARRVHAQPGGKARARRARRAAPVDRDEAQAAAEARLLRTRHAHQRHRRGRRPPQVRLPSASASASYAHILICYVHALSFSADNSSSASTASRATGPSKWATPLCMPRRTQWLTDFNCCSPVNTVRYWATCGLRM